ncbi:MAG: SelB C-terminal domain-containing protein, partial [bacterium]
KFHKDNPFRLGLKRPELRAKAASGFSAPLYEAVLVGLVAVAEVVVEDDRVRLSGHELKLSPAEKKLFDRAADLYREAGLAPPPLPEALAGAEKKLSDRVRTALLESGTLSDVGESVVLHRETIRAAEATVRRLFESTPELSASEIRQGLDTTRKILIPLLNYFDSRGVTQRKGEVRVLRK